MGLFLYPNITAMGTSLSATLAGYYNNQAMRDDEIDRKNCILSIVNLINYKDLDPEILSKIKSLNSKGIYIIYILEKENAVLAEKLIKDGFDQNAAMITLKSAETLFERDGMLTQLKVI